MENDKKIVAEINDDISQLGGGVSDSSVKKIVTKKEKVNNQAMIQKKNLYLKKLNLFLINHLYLKHLKVLHLNLNQQPRHLQQLKSLNHLTPYIIQVIS